ncbi:MAG: aconitate hydratase [Deltaproteobacteria bacterium]|nr:aconitate hydratase [Deltaproteobacteria bacterium]
MGQTITEKLLQRHLISGAFVPGQEIGIRIDQTLTQDATGTMTYLQFESMKCERVKTELSVSYIDHNTIQIGYENADDHQYLQSIAAKYGLYLSRAGNGICHQVHLERFGKPGKTLLGADSHTPMGGALGMFAAGAGGLDVALALAGESFYLTCPRVIKIDLQGRLQPWVSAKDIILKVLSIFSTEGNVGYVFEYSGEGTASLSVPERATIANMGAECGVTTSVFPSDEQTRIFLKAQRRGEDWVELQADANAVYDQVVHIDLTELEPLCAKPHSPGNVTRVKEVTNVKVDQVCIGSCTNSSYRDMVMVARILEHRVVHPGVSLIIAPGSKQVLENLARDGYLADLISAGARIMESACGFCIGNSQSPSSGAVSLRTSNRNFPGRSGTQDADVYLVSPETAVAAVVTGRIADPRELDIDYPEVKMPKKFYVDDNMIIEPPDPEIAAGMTIYRGPNIGGQPHNDPMPDAIKGCVTIKVGDKITTDHIMPAGERMKYRSNIPRYAEFVFENLDPNFYGRAMKLKREGRHNIILAGFSYGQGSSREHAAICPMYLGVRAVIAKSFERIHATNLINYGIMPLVFKKEADYDLIDQDDAIEIPDVRTLIDAGGEIIVKNMTKKSSHTALCHVSERQKRMLLAGGVLNLRQEY